IGIKIKLFNALKLFFDLSLLNKNNIKSMYMQLKKGTMQLIL
ncbi:hypothetical protein, partial [Plasmodium yoelii yoelii]